jgi:transposase
MTTQTRRRWTADEKLKILDEARQAGQSISDVCRRHQIAPGQFYTWEKVARAGAREALRSQPRGPTAPDPTSQLQAEVTRLRAVVAELSVENLTLKKGRWP